MVGEGVESLIDRADAEDVLNYKCVKYSIEEHVIWQVVETVARTKPRSTQGGRPG